PGNYFVDYWLHTKHINELTSSITSQTFGQNTGFYLGAEQMIYKENKDKPADDQGLTALGQFGWTPSNRNVLTQYYGAGFQYKGLIPKHDMDIIGMGSSIGKFSERLQNISGDGRSGCESRLEMFYKFQLTKWLAIMPDLQYIFHLDGKKRNSFLMGIRFNVTL
ncbi:MAG: carbohydrate porin, partial [Candidatus Gastranaerophilaceae bacterium]